MLTGKNSQRGIDELLVPEFLVILLTSFRRAVVAAGLFGKHKLPKCKEVSVPHLCDNRCSQLLLSNGKLVIQPFWNAVYRKCMFLQRVFCVSQDA